MIKTIVNKIPNHEAFLTGERSLDIGYPWLTYGAIMALEGLVNKRFKVLEIGSGGSTVFWAKNCFNVKSFESDPAWYEKVSKKTRWNKNVEVVLANEAKTLKALSNEPDGHYSVILVDSNPKQVNRLSVANAVISKLKVGGYLIIDNYQKFGMENFKYPKSEIYTFDQLRYSGKGTRICKIL